ncbi:flavin monoamine oxidase family protein [Mycolicibacterium brumae]|uniref:FAD-dependent oxidoreductase n=1 Tax=Mycolicibacterium brumae TaxID=85968 RepID=A0A2G5PDY6_9MYCO|nr:NAD(P)/FAD-dependent oxidoreductase [Mycolicibacterium brumae]MCV7192707.1 FAD-dependent oxidoreductase [Mycolicibacterium brumae]PIB76555.1 FAD-dependent oxidoreductase [Mycolicibacterium brumae]RWA23293.1 hypothetical protein MBRU_00305 [Mycolicibacterium brumae DSM 44177]UWW08779.1 FAD-dependent oxidoreductase [Mycolicibacterium brumae]
MTEFDTIVVGAGISGLTAARLLSRHGQKVVVFEARDRVGGRLHTLREDGRITDVGGSWIHGVGDSEELHNAVRAFGMPTVEFTVGSFQAGGRPIAYYGPDGGRLSDAETASFIADVAAIDADLTQTLSAAKPGTSYEQAVEDALDRLGWQGERADRVREHLRHRSEEQLGADAADLEALSLTDETVAGDEVVFPEGYDRLATGLADGIDVRLEHPVHTVRWTDSGAQAQVMAPDGTSEWVGARHVVVTVPVGVLRSGGLVFDPPLPEPVAGALDRFRMNSFEKIILRFPQRFWDADVYAIRRQGPAGKRWHSWYDLSGLHGQPALLTFAAGGVAREIHDWSEDEVVASVMASLRDIYGDAVPDPSHATVTHWADDPLAGGGAYSYPVVGTAPEDHDRLATPLGAGTVCLAGEATWSDDPCTVSAALLSGHRAAQHILGRDIGFDLAPHGG